MRSYRDLVAWQRGVDLAEAVYGLSRGFPREELYGLTAQIRKAAVSVPSNIAEGYGRGTPAAYLSFLRIAKGSLREVETQLIIAGRVGLAAETDVAAVLALCDETARILHALITSREGRS